MELRVECLQVGVSVEGFVKQALLNAGSTL